ncbi:hypothetical protein FACS189413_18140 [Bacteroidia bacterium]|nr:hypothetical protein FACS189413_18140 [Bacteroidia bacterium]
MRAKVTLILENYKLCYSSYNPRRALHRLIWADGEEIIEKNETFRLKDGVLDGIIILFRNYAEYLTLHYSRNFPY